VMAGSGSADPDPQIASIRQSLGHTPDVHPH
jgi:hypothetical protein